MSATPEASRTDADTALLHAAATGSEEALQALLTRYTPLIRGVCARILGPSPAVDDAVQATCLAFVRTLHRLHPDTTLALWFHRLARAAAIDLWRRERARHRHEQPLGSETVAPAPAGAAREDLRDRLDTALARLPATERAALVLCYLQGCSMGEAAAALRCPEATVRTRVHRGLRRLRDRLGRQELSVAAVAALLAQGSSSPVGPAVAAGTLLHASPTPAVAQLARRITTGTSVPAVAGLVAVALAAAAVAVGVQPRHQHPHGISSATIVPAAVPAAGTTTAGAPDAADPLPVVRVLAGSDVDNVFSVDFLANGQLLSTGGDHAARRWDPLTGACTAVWRAHTLAVSAAAFDHAQRLLATVGFDRQLCLWSLPEGRLRAQLTAGAAKLWAVAVAPDASWVAAGGDDGRIRIWSTERLTLLATLPGSDCQRRLAVSPEGTVLLAAGNDDVVRRWDTRQWQPLPALPHAPMVRAIAWSPDGRSVAEGDREGGVAVWSIDGTLRWHHDGPNATVEAVAFTHDGRWLLSGGDDHHCRLWRVADGRLCADQPVPTDISSLSVAPDDRMCAYGSWGRPITLLRLPASR